MARLCLALAPGTLRKVDVASAGPGGRPQVEWRGDAGPGTGLGRGEVLLRSSATRGPGTGSRSHEDFNPACLDGVPCLEPPGKLDLKARDGVPKAEGGAYGKTLKRCVLMNEAMRHAGELAVELSEVYGAAVGGSGWHLVEVSREAIGVRHGQARTPKVTVALLDDEWPGRNRSVTST